MKTPEGIRIPSITVKALEGGKLVDQRTDTVFGKGKRVVAFSLPGAFTPTCSTSHVPRFAELAPSFRKAGVDDIVCISVNDAFVMDAWKKDQHAEGITFLADGNGELTKALGMLVDKRGLGFGERSWRYSMLVEDGVVKKAFVEPEVEGDPFEVSDADTMLRHLAPELTGPRDILLFTKPGCAHCTRAKKALEERGLAYEEVRSTPRNLRAVSGKHTTPQVFVDGRYVGGADELIALLATLR
ncbi:MAG: glutathione peroxidase [Sandaracinaceae bacterium]|nr:glutathione peroxidase [Sandaracinaceae bacterium]